MNDYFLILLVIGTLGLVGSTFSSSIKQRWYLTAPLGAFALGAVVGPEVLVWLDPTGWPWDRNTVLIEAARITLVVVDLGVAMQLPRGYPLARWRSMATMWGLLMLLMWLASTFAIWLVFGFPLWISLLVGAVVTSTDPVVARSITNGGLARRNLPVALRNLISGESAGNDGAAYAIVLLPVLMLSYAVEDALGRWGSEVLLQTIGGAVIVGIVLGIGAGHLLRWAKSTGIVQPKSFLAYALALSFVVIGTSKLLGIDSVLAAFVTGVAFRMVKQREEEKQEQKIQTSVARLFLLPFFALFGLYAPWQAWWSLGWKGAAVAALVLIVRRLPWLWLVSPLVPQLKSRRDKWFVGWFGPIGVSTIFYAILAVQKTGQQEPWIIGSLIVFASLLAHGWTGTPFTRWYGGSQRPDVPRAFP